MNSIVNTMTLKAMSHYTKGQYEMAKTLLEDIRKSGYTPDYTIEKNLLPEIYHSTGEIIKCYRAAKEIATIQNLEPILRQRVLHWVDYYTVSMKLVDNIPPAPKGIFKQSKHNSNVSYDEWDYDPYGKAIWKQREASGKFIRKVDDLVAKIEECNKSSNSEMRIYGHYIQGINLPKDRFADERVNHLIQCVLKQPSKALYWGQLAIELQSKGDPKNTNEMLYAIQNAIDLDPSNAHWIYEKGKILANRIQLSKDAQSQILACLAVIDQLKLAASLTRADEIIFRQMITEDLELYINAIPNEYKTAMKLQL